MRYNHIVKGTFISRPNRFIAKVMTDGKEETVHVKNTGRCAELLVKGATVFLEKSDNPSRKTPYDLISVYKNDMLVNMDSQAPNKVFGEWLKTVSTVTKIKPECVFGKSRIDFYIEQGDVKSFVEIKGVTLEEDGVALFPDAPTERGVKHINELCACLEQGYKAAIVFIIQMRGTRVFKPNGVRHPEFKEALQKASAAGVGVYALDCTVSEDCLEVHDFIPVDLT